MAETLATVTLLMSVAFGNIEWKLMVNNIDQSQEHQAIGSWSNWLTGYHVNERHDGYLDIGTTSFDPTKLALSYSSPTNCTNDYPVFADGKIVCVDITNNMLLAYKPLDGSVGFWYLNIGASTLQNPTFATSGDKLSIFIYWYQTSQLHMSSFDATTGLIQHHLYNTKTSRKYIKYQTSNMTMNKHAIIRIYTFHLISNTNLNQ